MKWKIVFAAAGAIMASSCATMPGMSAARPQCAPKSYTIYYNYLEDDLRASAAPIIRSVAEQVASCETSGGKLNRVTIIGFPNRTENSAGGDKTAAARGQAVLEALVAAGLPVQKIKLANYRTQPSDLNEPMRRRAEIALKMR
jgi:hypothetical protein